MTTDLASHRESFMTDLRQGKLRGSSYDVAHATVCYLRRVLVSGKYTTYGELLNVIKSEGNTISQAEPTEFVVGNMVLRVLKLIREEECRSAKGADASIDGYDSLNRLWERESGSMSAAATKQWRTIVLEAVKEFLEEMENCRDNIAVQALDHIQQNDTVMTVGDSKSICAFLKAAGRKRKFTVLVVDGAPLYKGRELAQKLSVEEEDSPGLPTVTQVSDASVFVRMTQVTKVLISAYCVLADGGFIGPSGTYALALAAKHYSVPVIVLAGFYKLTPKFLSNEEQEMFNRLTSPRHVIAPTDGLIDKAEVINPLFDFVPPELVTLYVTDTSGNAPSYVYRLLTEHYHPDDLDVM